MVRQWIIASSLLVNGTASVADAAKEDKPAAPKTEAKGDDKPEAKNVDKPEAKGVDKAEPEPDFWQSLVYQRNSVVSLLAVQGVNAQQAGFRPTRELRLTDKSRLVAGANSLVWNLRLEVGRQALAGGHQDEPLSDPPTTLPSGSVLGRNAALVVQEGYFQHVAETWMIQVGSQLFAWGSADSLNPTSVMNPQDLRTGLLGDKETKIAPIPTVRLALLAEGSTLNFVYAPWRRASLLPGPSQNWYLAPDNLAFGVHVTPNQHVENRGSYAVKYDRTIEGGDLSLLYYAGADYDVELLPESLQVVNNQPLTVDLVQEIPDKTAYGVSYSQTFGKWVLKAEGLFTANKRAMPDVDKAHVQTVQFPLELKTTGYVQSTVGFNYFAPITQFSGIPLGDTVLTAEYYKAQYTGKGLASPTLSDLIIANLRTSALADRLEILATYGLDPAKTGRTWSSKWTFSGEQLRHSFLYAGFDGLTPAANAVGSIFYYWRHNTLVSYEVAYPF